MVVLLSRLINTRIIHHHLEMAAHVPNKSCKGAIDAKGASENATYALSDSSSDQTSISEGRTFLTAGLKDVYVPIDRYEGKHRWDVNFQWTPNEEKAVVRKVCASLSFLIHLADLSLDRPENLCLVSSLELR